jgi:hypothetical protein
VGNADRAGCGLKETCPVEDMMYDMLVLDVRTLIGVLSYGNAIGAVFLFLYWLHGRQQSEKRLAKHLLTAKIFQAVACYFFFHRNALSGTFYVSMGNTSFFIGFYFEAISILLIMRADNRLLRRIFLTILAFSIIVFNFVEWRVPASNIRVAIASSCVFLLMFIPSIMLVASRHSSAFAKATGILYVFFLLLLLPRTWHSLGHIETSILTNNFVQTLTFSSLL